MVHDRVHAREPTHDRDRWTVGRLVGLTERDGHAVATVVPEESDGDEVELVVTLAVRDLFVSRLNLGPDESPVGERVWYRKKGC